MYKTIAFILNNEKVQVSVDIRKSLLELLREDFHLMGSKEGCSVGECGACTVIMDGKNIDACITMAVWADNTELTTIEGITCEDGSLSDLQEAYVTKGAVQCGFCTPGMILSSEVLLKHTSQPTRKEIRRGLSGNMCRCTGYQKIIDAVEYTAQNRLTSTLPSIQKK